MLDHIGLQVHRCEQSKACYREALVPLGYLLILTFMMVPDGHNIESVCHTPVQP